MFTNALTAAFSVSAAAAELPGSDAADPISRLFLRAVSDGQRSVLRGGISADRPPAPLRLHNAAVRTSPGSAGRLSPDHGGDLVPGDAEAADHHSLSFAVCRPHWRR